MLSKGLLLLAVFTALALAAPEEFDDFSDFQNDQPSVGTSCAIVCPVSSSPKFGYQPGKTYEYRYESDVKTSVPGLMAEHSSLHMRATVQVEALSTCEMSIRLSDVSLQDSNPTNFENRQHVENAVEFKRALQARPMSFSFTDGRIDSICPSIEESTWVLNIKRAILSSLQNTMTNLQGATNSRETDISGDCPVRYEVTGSWGHKTVKKTKNLLACTNRQSGQSIFQGVEYDAPSDIQSMPLMKSSHSCEQQISNQDRIITKSTCTETHVFRPFAKHNSGATTEVSYKMEFQRQTESISSSRQAISNSGRSTLLYDHTLTNEEVEDAVRGARESLSSLCRLTEVDVRPDAPSTFNGLVKQMRKLDANNLRRLLGTIKSGICQKAEQYFRDALPLLGTTGGIVMMRELLSQATERETEVWMTSIAFISNPTQEMMKELQPLLTSDFERAALPVSSLIHTYCQIYDESDNSEVQQMIKTMEDELRYNCKIESDQQRTRIMRALKAIGNAGNAERVVPTLNRCIANSETPIAVRVAATAAFRRLSCTADRNNLLSLVENRQADSELRISAYLAVMQCPTESIITRIKTLLESDEVNQVGSFIWTHLTNLQETSCPMKADIQDLLKDVILSKTYDVDKRKFSRNIELSGFSEVLNMGALLESNLIFSEQSYVPRSASMNLTVDVFGQSINLFEIGGRAQGLEALLERFFGPGGDMNNAIRQKRAVFRDDTLNIIDRKFSKTRDDLALSYYLRIFGNEIRSSEIFDIDVEGLKNRFNFLDWLIKLAQENTIDVTRNFMFLDATHVVPTAVGLPLRLGVEGTATVAVTASGKVDIRQMFSKPSVFDINGSIRPSAAIEIKGEMGVDARFTRTGLKTISTLHTSTLLDGKVQLQDGKIFNLDLNMPQEKIEVFSAESHFYITYRGQDREQKDLIPRSFQKTECTGQMAMAITGVQLCGEVSLAVPYIAKVYLNKRDTYSGFHFEAGYRESSAEKTETVRVSFNTPGSGIDREITADFKLDRANSQVEVNLKSPWKKVSAQGSMVNSAALKRATLRAVIDEVQEYSVNAEVQIDDKRTEIRYTPQVKVVYPDPRGQQNEIVFDGTVVYTKGRKATVNVALKNAFPQPITLDGSVELVNKRTTSKYDVNFQFSSPVVKGGLIGFVSNSQEAGNTWSSRADLSYQLTGSRTKERVVINHKFRDLSTSNLRSYSTDLSWTTTMASRYNGQVGLELAFSPNSLRTKIEAGLDNVKKITIIQSGAFDFSGADKKINGLLKLELPYKNWDYELKVDHIHNTDSLQTNATVKYDENKQVSIDVGLKKDNARFLNIEAEAFFRMPSVETSLTTKLTERAPREYYGELNVQGIPKIQSATLSTFYKMVPRHEFSADLTLQGRNPISLKGHLLPNIKNMQARVELSYNSKNYMADINWLHRGTATAFNTRANAEFAYFGKSRGITMEVSRRNQEFTTNFEVKMAENMKFSLGSQVTTSPSEPKVQIRAEWPENFMALTASGKYETKGWYTTTNDLEGTVEFTSSLQNLEKIGGFFRHDQSAKSIKTNGEVYWALDKKITGDFSYDKNKIIIDLTSPFSGYTTMKAEALYTPRGKGIVHTTKISWEANQMILTITGDLNYPSVNGKITFTSPFRGFESLSTSLKHGAAGDKYQTYADVVWARGQQISLAINMNHNLNGWYMTNSGDLTIQTPFRGFRLTKLNWNHQNDNSAWKCHSELELERQKYIVDVDSTHQLTRVARRMTAAVSFQSPIQGYENLRFNSEFQYDLRGVKSTGKSSLSWGSKSLTHEHDVTYIPNRALMIKGEITTPFQSFESMSLNMNNRRMGNTFTASNEMTVGRYGKSTLGGNLNYEGSTIEANIRLTTPFRYLERASASLKNSKQNDIWLSHADVEYSPDKSYSIDTKLGWESQKKIEVEIRTPHSVIQSLKFNAEANGHLRAFNIMSELEHNTFQQGKITFSMSADTQDLRNMNGQVAIITPFQRFSNFKASLSHTKVSAQSCVTAGSYEYNRLRGSFKHEQQARSWVDFNTKSEVEYITGKKMELATSFTVGDKLAGSATFRSPFAVAREIVVNMGREGTLDNFKSFVEVTYNRRDKTNANLEFSFRRGTLRSVARLITPYRQVERLAYEINHSGSLTNFRSDATFEYNDRKISGSTQFLLEDTNLQISGQLETPFSALRQGSISLTHNGGWRSFNNNANIVYNGNTITAGSEFNLDGPVGKFTLRTPYEQLQEVVFNFNHEVKTGGRAGKGWSNNASLQFNGQTYTGASEWIWIGRQLRAKAAVNIPQEYSLSLQHRGESLKDFSNTLTIKIEQQSITGTSSFKYSNTLIDAKATIETTYANYNKFEATFRHEGSINDFTTKAAIVTPFRNYRSFSSELTYHGTQNDFTSSLSMSTPFRTMPRLTVSLNHKFTEQSLNSAVTITTTDQPITASISYQKDGSSIDASARIQTPYNGYENFAVTSTFNGDVSSFRSSVTVTTPFEGYERFYAELNHSGPWRRFKTSGKFESTPVPLVSLSLEHSSPNAFQINTNAEVMIPSGRFAAELTHTGEPGNFRSGVKVTTPYQRGRFEVNLEHEGGLETPKSKLTVVTPFRGYNNFQLTGEKSGTLSNLQLKAELTTPIRGWERQAASWSHIIDAERMVTLNGQIETSVSGWEKVSGSLNFNGIADQFQMTVTLETPKQSYEKQSLSIAHNSRRNIKTTVVVETSIPDYNRVSGTFEYNSNRRSTKSTISAQIPGYDKFSANVEHNALDNNGFRTTFQVVTPFPEYNRFAATINHNGDLMQFETSASITTPFRQMSQIDAVVRHRGQLTDFTTGGSVEYSGKKVETEVSFKRTASRHESNYEGKITLNTPCPYIRDFNLVASHRRQTDVKSGALDLTMNGEKKVGFDYQYTTTGDRKVEINIRDPYSMATELKMAGTDGQAVINWDTSRPDSQIRFDFGFKNTETSDLTERLIRLKTVIPRRTIGFEFGYTLTMDKFTNRGELQWDSDPESEFIYEIEGTKTSTRYVNNYDGSLKIISSLVTSTVTLSHKANARRQHTTELAIQGAERLRVSNDLTFTQNGFKDTFLIQHPRFTQDASIITEVSYGGNTKIAKTTVRYERETFNIEGQVTDESSYGNIKSSGSFRFSHPRSFTDIQATGDIFSDYEKAGGNAEVQYQMSRDRSIQKLSLSTQVNKARNEFSLELNSPVDSLRLALNNRYADDSNQMYGYEMSVQTNQNNYKTVADLSIKDRSLDVKLYWNADDYVHMYSQALTPFQANFDLSRFISGQRIGDIAASLSLTNERLLVGNAFIRPNLWREMKEFFQRPDRLYPQELATRLQVLSQSLSHDFNVKVVRMKQAGAPFITAYNAISNDINAKTEEFRVVFNEIYNRNEFYIRDIHLALKRASDQIAQKIQAKMAEFKRSFNDFSYRANRYMVYYRNRMQQRLNLLARDFAESWQTTIDRFEAIRPQWENFINAVKANLAEVREYIENDPRIRAFVARVKALQPSDFLPPADMLERFQRIYYNYRMKVEEIMSRPELREVKEYILRRIQENMWLYEYFGYREQVTTWIEQARAMTWDNLKVMTVNYIKEYLQLNKNGWTTWDVRNGRYAFQIYIPFDLPDLSFLQRLNVKKYVDFARNVIVKMIPDEDWTLLDTIYTYWPSRDIFNWIPPFKSHASITGTQHFMTYDHRFYEFAGECSYLLTRDFVDKSFSVIVNYDRAVNNQPVKKSITVISDGKQLEIFPDARLTLDGTRIEMPVRIANTTVLRVGNAIRVDDDRGFSVYCDLPHDHCSVSVSGWYYNKMAGLLGTYDNEPSNDMLTIDNTQADKPETLAHSWTVGTKCRLNNKAIEQQVDEDSNRYQICAKYFKDASSQFRSCFRQVNPEPFLKMCINDMPATDDIASEEGICKISAAYVQECRRHEVHLRVPRPCVRCELSDSSRVYYESSTFQYSAEEPAPKNADVVFIVQHAPCNKDLLSKVKDLVDDIDKAMTAEGLTNTRYAIVGFGGKNHLSAAHVHTMDGQIFNSANKISQGLNRFDLEAGDSKDPMGAIQYAAKLAFRAGASKTFIFLGCDACSETSIRYRDLQRVLLNSDIRLHVLVQDLIRLKSQSAKTAYIFGADQDTVYTRKDVASDDLSGEPDLRRYIRIPKDLCVALTQDTDGSIFSSRQWLDSRPLIQKRFTDVMVRTFARKAQPSECQECECVADEFGVGYTQCSKCRARDPFYSDYPRFDEDEDLVVPAEPQQQPQPNQSRPDINVQEPTTRPSRVVTTRRPRPTPRTRPPRVRPPPRATRQPAIRRPPAATPRPRPQPAVRQ